MQQNIYHLSHTDLDGYASQFVMKYTSYNIYNYNANYGAEVKQQLEMILSHINNKQDKAIMLITDLNLTIDEAKWLDREINKKDFIDLILLDHHGSGENCANRYEWYNLDTTQCATKLIYEYAKKYFNLKDSKQLDDFVNVVNTIDLWQQNNTQEFEYGKVCMRLINEAKELNRVMFPKEDNLYKLTLLEKSIDFLHAHNAPIELDNKIHFLKKDFFKEDKDDTLDNLSTNYIVKLLGMQTSEKTIYYKGYKGFLSYGVGNTSIIGNGFLLSYPDYDFIVDVSYRGTMSLRANNNVDVSKIAKEWADGGGHPNAAGGRIVGFKEQYRYDKVKEQIEKIIHEKESIAGVLQYKS